LRVFFTLLVVLMLAVISLPAQAQGPKPEQVGLRPDAPEYAKHGQFWVGTIAIEGKTEFHPTIVQIWYPATNPEAKQESTTYFAGPKHDLPMQGRAIVDVAPDSSSGPYPLVIFAHGLGGGNAAAAYLCEHLASRGFIVMAVNYADSGDTDVPNDPALSFYTRPKDVSWQLDYAEQLNKDEDGKLSGMFDLEHIAVVGHSFGGYTAFAVSGAPLDVSGPTSWCSKHPAQDLPLEVGGGVLQDRFCNKADQIAKLAGLQKTPERLWPAWADPRVDALVSLAPWTILFGAESVKTVTVPTLVMYGTKDQIVWTDDELYRPYVYDNLGATAKSLVLFEQGAHILFSVECEAAPWLVAAGFHDPCSRPDQPLCYRLPARRAEGRQGRAQGVAARRGEVPRRHVSDDHEIGIRRS
jgi:predicted dienelactone hydrolase